MMYFSTSRYQDGFFAMGSSHDFQSGIYLNSFKSGLKPDPKLTVSAWAQTFRRLPSASSEPGRWKNTRTPYLIEIMDYLSTTDPTQKVIFMKGAQIGGSEAGFNFIGYIIDIAPSGILHVQPTESTAKKVSRQRIGPLISETESLSQKVAQVRTRLSTNTWAYKEFPGGDLSIAGANAPAGLRSMPRKYLFLDEVDEYPDDLEGQGDPIDLATARTRSYPGRKIFMASTPTKQSTSKIALAFKSSTRKFFEVPCPHCNHFQRITWEKMKYDKIPETEEIDSSTIRMICESCQEPIYNHDKHTMLAGGKWVAENPNHPVQGFHLSGLYSPLGWFSWQEALEMYKKALVDEPTMIVFQNTVLGLPYDPPAEAPPDWRKIYNRRESYPIGTVPEGPSILVGACDVQKNRLEVMIAGFHKREMWIIDHEIIPGNTAMDVDEEPWSTLRNIIQSNVEKYDGGQLPLVRFGIDSGWNTTRVYDFCRMFNPKQVFPLKGNDTQITPVGRPRKIDVRNSGKFAKKGLNLVIAGSSVLKDDVYGRLFLKQPTKKELEKSGYPPTYIHFPEFDEEFFRQLTAEKKVILPAKDGKIKYRWVKEYSRNETLDLTAYCLACYYHAGLHKLSEDLWDDLKKS